MVQICVVNFYLIPRKGDVNSLPLVHKWETKSWHFVPLTVYLLVQANNLTWTLILTCVTKQNSLPIIHVFARSNFVWHCVFIPDTCCRTWVLVVDGILNVCCEIAAVVLDGMRPPPRVETPGCCCWFIPPVAVEDAGLLLFDMFIILGVLLAGFILWGKTSPPVCWPWGGEGCIIWPPLPVPDPSGLGTGPWSWKLIGLGAIPIGLGTIDRGLGATPKIHIIKCGNFQLREFEDLR